MSSLKNYAHFTFFILKEISHIFYILVFPLCLIKTTTEMKKLLFVSIITVLFVQNAFTQILPNSKKFDIKDFLLQGPTGSLKHFNSKGFIQHTASGSSGRVFILPTVKIDFANIKYSGDDGISYDAYLGDDVPARSITIPITYHLELPLKSEIPVLYDASVGLQLTRFFPEPLPIKFDDWTWNSWEAINYPGFKNTMKSIYDQYVNDYNNQQAKIAKFANYAAEKVSLNSLEVTLNVDDEYISGKKYTGDFFVGDNILTTISIRNPDLYTQNKILQKQFEIVASYKFRDAKTSTISAQFDASQIINHVLEESQKSLQKKKSSGWSVLGFGQRRKSIRTSINQQVNNQVNDNSLEGTKIEIFDADDSMIDNFENNFFPVINKNEVINNHKIAAINAANDGKDSLSNLHLSYAKAIEENDPNLETDIAGALASLAAQDYIGFVAKGVRWGSNTGTGSNSFRSTITSNIEISKRKDWLQSKTISVQRTLTERIPFIAQRLKHQPYFGFMLTLETSYQVFGTDNWGRPIPTGYSKGVVPVLVAKGGPAHLSGIQPGMIITFIDGVPITTNDDFKLKLKDRNPGEEVILLTRKLYGPHLGTEIKISSN